MEFVEIENKQGERESVPVYSVQDFPWDQVNPIAMSSRSGGRDRIGYMLEYMTFDIETTTRRGRRTKKGEWIVKPSAFMWHWQACLGGICVFGRRWEEFFEFCGEISRRFKLGERKRLVCYVHNLAFEFAFLYPFLAEQFGGYQLFATGSHKPVKVTCGNGIEFRCSYKLSNMSLYNFTKTELYCPYVKAWGDLDYKKIRTADSPVTAEEKGYNLIDVLGLYHAIKSLMQSERDNVTTIPLTSTGYVRRIARRNCRKYPDYRKKVFNKVKVTWPVYQLLKEESRGGNTHANRWLAGRIIDLVDSYDYVSEYPAQMLLHDFPMSQFSPYGDIESEAELNALCEEKAVLFRVTFEHLHVKDGVAMPYLPISKAWFKSGKVEGDNGRLLISHGIVSYTFNEIDWAIVREQYDWDGMIIQDVRCAKKGPLPEPIRDTVKQFFAIKCELKALKEELGKVLESGQATAAQIDEYNLLEYKYGKIKNKLNGIFGMMFQDPVILQNVMDAVGKWKETPGEKTEEQLLDKYNNSRNSFLCYAWGCWVTAYGRLMLHKLQGCARSGDLSTAIYSDTDSVKAYLWDMAALDALNAWIKARCEERGAYYDHKDGTREYMGVAEHDGTAKRFITMGAKKYAYIDKKDLLHVTVSGVSTAKAPGEMVGAGAKELGSIERFRVGFKFKAAGGSEIWYGHDEPHYITVKGCRMLTASYAAVLDGTYTLSLTPEYSDLIGYV